jgi:hypothetical protein
MKAKAQHTFPVVSPWRPFDTITQATAEAKRMREQYERITRMKFSCPSGTMAQFERLSLEARREWNDAESFLVSLRRKGFEVAIQDAYVEHTVIDEESGKAVELSANLTLFETPKPQARQEAPWSTMAHR